jgi:LacI family transcriptional regulator
MTDSLPSRLDPVAGRSWRGPTIAEIAKESGLGTATVDRVLNGRHNVREATRAKVAAALAALGGARGAAPQQERRTITFLSEAGASFNQTLEKNILDYCGANPGIACPFIGVTSGQLDPVKFANFIERAAAESDGLVVKAREDLTINRAIRNVIARGAPVVCMTTDLPTTGRAAYIGNDQTSAGSTAAHLMGQLAGAREAKILLVYSAPYRAQEERELGFRRVLRSEYSHLEVDDRVNSNDDSEHAYRHVMKYIADHGAPAGIYNTVAGNLGIGRALTEHGLAGKTVFIGHELNANSRMLLESGVMHFAIGHDVDREVAQSIEYLLALLGNRPPPPLAPTQVRVYTKYNCY